MHSESVLAVAWAPWKLWNLVDRLLCYPWVRIQFFLNSIPWRRGWHFYGMPIIQKHRQSTMQFGNDLQLRSSLRSNPLGPNHPVFLTTWQKGACLTIGDRFAMTGGAICCANSIIIGNNVRMGANSTIVDTDFHPLDPAYRRLHPTDGTTAPVVIEDDVFIGMNSLILKGVHIGKGSIVGAGSVVARDVLPHMIVAGNPIREIRKIE